MLKGSKHTEENKKRISEALKGRKRPPFSEEHKRKISESKKGCKLSDEHRAQISLQTSGTGNPRYGKSHSPEQTLKWRTTIEKNQSLMGENNPNWNPSLDREGIKIYRSAVMRKSKKNANSVAMLDGLVVGRGKNGVELDHIVPISVCYIEGVSIQSAASLKNLQVLHWMVNMLKLNHSYPEDLLQELKGSKL